MDDNLLDKDRQQVAQFLQAAESGAAQAGLTGLQREKINEFVVDQRNNYVNAAMVINSGRFSKSSPAYLEAIQRMNRVKSNLANLANQQKMIAENQKQYLDDFQSDRISKANYDKNSPAMLTDVYTGKADLKIDELGNLMFGKDDKFKKYSDIANYSLKATDTANDLLNIADRLAASKYRMTNASLKLHKNRIKNKIDKGGRNELLSLIKDDLLPGFSDLEIPQELYNPENYSKLKDFFLGTLNTALDDINNSLPKDPKFNKTSEINIQPKSKYDSGASLQDRKNIQKAAIELLNKGSYKGSQYYSFTFKGSDDKNSQKYFLYRDPNDGQLKYKKNRKSNVGQAIDLPTLNRELQLESSAQELINKYSTTQN